MTASEEEAKYNEARFLALISGLSGSAMQHLGKVVNPLTAKIERDLQSAKGTIDILRMLREKTKGNLSDREEKTLNALLGGLQLNYLDEVKAEAEKPEEKPEEKPPEEKKEEPTEEEKAEKPADVKKEEPSEEKKEEPAEEKKGERPTEGREEKPSEENGEAMPAAPLSFTDKIISRCPYCGYEASLKQFGTWEKEGKRGLLGKTADGFLMFLCPKCEKRIKYDSLSNKFLKQ